MVSSSSCSPSSSSSTKKKTFKFSRIQQTLFKKPSSSTKATSLIKRQETIFKKARELAILCGIEVCVICYGSDGELRTWPEDRKKVKDIARRYAALSETKRRKGSINLHEFVEKINKDDSNKKKKIKEVRPLSIVKYPVWDSMFDNYSVEQLMGLVQSLEHNQTRIQHRVHAVVEGQEQRTTTQYRYMGNQEPMRTTTMNHLQQQGQEQRTTTQYRNMGNQDPMRTTTMNHLQQQPNQVSMFLVNHGNGNISQIPALNQGQSLAAIPPELMIHLNSDVGTGSLGVQGTGINRYQNMKVLTYNNINNINGFLQQIDQNSKVESYSSLLGPQGYEINEFENTNMYNRNNFNMEAYSGLLGAQGTMFNGLQSMNMQNYNNNNNNSVNANCLSHQLAQIPTQQQYQAFNSDQSGNNIRHLYDI